MQRDPFSSYIDLAAWRRTLRRWRRFAETAETQDTDVLLNTARQAAKLQPFLDRVADVAEAKSGQILNTSIAPEQLPPRTEWTWQPGPWHQRVHPPGIAGFDSGTQFGEDVVLYHDCPLKEATLHQRAVDCKWVVTLDWTGFAGNYISTVIKLPREAAKAMCPKSVISLRGIFQSEQGGECFVRLNIRNGPNVAQINMQQDFSDEIQMASFDLAYARFNQERITGAWIDVIYEALPANFITLSDLRVIRHRRAEM